MVKKEYITWNEKLVLGVPVLDKQHEILIAKINNLNEVEPGNTDAETADMFASTNDLFCYIRYHFFTEEKLMILLEFDGYTVHKKQHDGYIAEILEKSKLLEDGTQRSFDNYIEFLKNWVFSDIRGYDTIFRDFIFEYKDHQKLMPLLSPKPLSENIYAS